MVRAVVAVIGNAIPLVGVWFLGWDVFIILAVYFFEGVVLGLVTVAQLRTRWRAAVGFVLFYGVVLFLQFGFFMVSLDSVSAQPLGVENAPALGWGMWWDVLAPFVQVHARAIAVSTLLLCLTHIARIYQNRKTEQDVVNIVAPALFHVIITLPVLALCAQYSARAVVGVVLLGKMVFGAKATKTK